MDEEESIPYLNSFLTTSAIMTQAGEIQILRHLWLVWLVHVVTKSYSPSVKGVNHCAQSIYIQLQRTYSRAFITYMQSSMPYIYKLHPRQTTCTPWRRKRI